LYIPPERNVFRFPLSEGLKGKSVYGRGLFIEALFDFRQGGLVWQFHPELPAEAEQKHPAEIEHLRFRFFFVEQIFDVMIDSFEFFLIV